nr:hypothetical protein [uncultured Sphingomonas sp.]
MILFVAAAGAVAIVAGGQYGPTNLVPDQLSAPTPSPVPTAPAVPAASLPGMAQPIAQWKALQQTDALPFDSYAGFLAQHPGWPGQNALRRTAEKKAATDPNTPATSVVAFCRRWPPLTTQGWVACARAYAATGASAQAQAAARTAWRLGTLTAQDEATITDRKSVV